MTMPHLMNCPHSDDSHCLDCVKKAWETTDAEITRLTRELAEARSQRDGLVKAVDHLSVMPRNLSVTAELTDDLTPDERAALMAWLRKAYEGGRRDAQKELKAAIDAAKGGA